MDNLNRRKPHYAHTNGNTAEAKRCYQAPDLLFVELQIAQERKR
jgi:hypothetical protein